MKNVKCKLWMLLFVLGALSVSAANQGRPNVLFILTDEWRAQATGYAGDPNVRTPNLDKMAESGLNFDTAVSVCAVCTPYRAALQTGRFPLSTGMYKNDLYMDPNEYCMAEIFKDAGYNTAYVGKWHLDGHGRTSYIPPERRQGYDYWKVLECTHNYANSKYYDNNDPEIKTWDDKYDGYAQTRDAQQYIREHANSDKPFLFFLSFGGPHYTHALSPKDLQATYPPESLKLRPNIKYDGFTEAELRKELMGYYAHCTAIDKCVGDLMGTLAELGIADNTIVVFTSDHGETMGSQGIKPKQKRHPYDEAIRVPFLMSYPPLTDGNARTIKTPINTPDILPTLLSLAGIEIPAMIEGDDLSVLVKEPGKELDRAALVMQVDGRYSPDYRGVRTERYWYSEEPDGGRKLLFDCEKDPYQMNNLIDNPEYAPLQQKMAARLKEELIKVDDYPFKNKQGYRQHTKRYSGVDGKGNKVGSRKKGVTKKKTPKKGKEGKKGER